MQPKFLFLKCKVKFEDLIEMTMYRERTYAKENLLLLNMEFSYPLQNILRNVKLKTEHVISETAFVLIR